MLSFAEPVTYPTMRLNRTQALQTHFPFLLKRCAYLPSTILIIRERLIHAVSIAQAKALASEILTVQVNVYSLPKLYASERKRWSRTESSHSMHCILRAPGLLQLCGMGHSTAATTYVAGTAGFMTVAAEHARNDIIAQGCRENKDVLRRPLEIQELAHNRSLSTNKNYDTIEYGSILYHFGEK